MSYVCHYIGKGVLLGGCLPTTHARPATFPLVRTSEALGRGCEGPI